MVTPLVQVAAAAAPSCPPHRTARARASKNRSARRIFAPLRPPAASRALAAAPATLAAALAIALAACDPGALAARAAADLTTRTRSAFARESEVELARAAAPAGLKQLEGFLLVAGRRRPLLEALAEGFCGWGAGFLHDEWEREVIERGGDGAALVTSARAALGRCAHYAAWQLRPPLDRIFTLGGGAAADALAAAGRDDAAPLYWLVTAHAALLGMTGELGLALRLPRMLEVLRRVNQLAPALAHGQAHALLGSLLAAAPILGDLDEAARQLALARAVTGGRLLLVDVLAARTLAVARGDRAQFTALLTAVLATSPAELPEARLANELAQRMARRSLRHADHWFPPSPAPPR